MRAWKIVSSLFCVTILASNFWSMRNWTERTGVYDDICYLRQAHLFSRFGLRGLDTDISRDDDGYFATLLKELNIPSREGNVCHTSIPATGKTVLQYPPGTGFVLSVFPSGFQRVPLYATSGLLILGITLAAIWSAKTEKSVALAGVLGGLGQYFMINPAKASFSMAPTMAVCALAGYLTTALLNGSGRRFLLSGATALLLGLSASFRLPNIFLSVGLFAYLSVDVLKKREVTSLVRLAVFGIAYLIGLSPILIANTINAGGPLSTTYGTGDAVPFDFSFSIVTEYLHDMQLWPIIAAFGWAAFGLCSRETRRVSVVVIANLIFSLIFFLGHPIFTPYYLMPIAMLSLWTLLWGTLATPPLWLAAESLPQHATS